MTAAPLQAANSLYLCAPVNALVEGLYKAPVSIRQLRRHGDFGLGTFNDLDGEMIMLDGQTYQATAAGEINCVGEETLTPFAGVVFYKALAWDEISEEMDYPAFENKLLSLLPSPNLCYALRIEGSFAYVRTRSVSRQENYRPLLEVAKEQAIFEFHDTAGTLAGFFTPAFLSSLSVPGLHLHFLSSDLRRGGHLLSCRPARIKVGIQFISKVELSLPMNLDYLTHDFNRPVDHDLELVERGSA